MDLSTLSPYLIVLALLPVVFALWGYARMRRQAGNPGFIQPDNPKSGVSEMAALRAEVAALEGRLRDLEETVRGGASAEQPGSEDPIYGPAVRLIRQGLSTEEVAGRLGLARAEVDLIRALHQDDRGTHSLP